MKPLALLGLACLVAVSCGQPTLHGTLTLTSSSGVSHSGTSCQGTAGYDDLTQGAPVTVKNENGSIIATSSLDAGVADSTYPTVVCHFSFTVENLPDAKFYAIEISHRGEVTYSKDQLSGNGWKADATIGD